MKNMKKNTTRVLLLFTALFLLAIFLPINTALVAKDTKTDKLLADFPVKEGDEFILSFTHSINKRPVYEYIKIDHGQLNIYKARYDAFGAGMPETSADGELLTMKEHGILELTGINRKKDEIALFVGTVAGHSIKINGRTIPLNTITQPGKSLTFMVSKVSYYAFWKGRTIS